MTPPANLGRLSVTRAIETRGVLDQASAELDADDRPLIESTVHSWLGVAIPGHAAVPGLFSGRRDGDFMQLALAPG